jgi:branched-chain amino acid transport system permease protein
MKVVERLRSTLGLSIGLFVALATWVVWSGRQPPKLPPFSLDNVATALFTGLAIGALYALYATGIVVVYTTTGIFNFSQAAIGAFCAFLYWQFRVDWHWTALPALAIVILVVAPLIGLLLDRLIMRRLEGAPVVVQLLVTVGVMYFILTATGQLWQQDTPRKLPAFYGTKSIDLGPINLTYHRAIVLVVALIVAGALRLLFRSRLGVSMRAVVDNRSLSALTGAKPDVVSSVAWALGAMLAATAGILIAPEYELDPSNLNAVLVVAFAAAAFGQLKSLPLALIGALLIGVGRQFMTSFLKFGGDWQFSKDGLAPVVLLLVVLALPQSRLEVGRVTRNLKKHERTSKVWESALGGAVLILAFLTLSGGWLHLGVWNPGAWNEVALNRGNVAMATAFIGMSLVPLTGWAGQLNFAPMAFAGWGAFLHLKFALDADAKTVSVWWLLFIGLLSAPLGALVALVAGRLRGLYLALASIAFTELMARLFFPHPRAGLREAVRFQPFDVFGLALTTRRQLLMLLVVIFVIFMISLTALRQSRYGRRWVALNNSEAASATVGVSVATTKVVVYAVSAAMAGIGGSLFATASGSVDAVRTFTLDMSIPIVLLMAIGGMAYPIAAIFTTFQVLLLALGERLEQAGAPGWLLGVVTFMKFFGPGLGAIGMVVNQRGAAFETGRQNARYLPWRKDAKEEYAAMRAKAHEPEVGELGIDRPFTTADVVAIERMLGIDEDVAPGRHRMSRGGAPNVAVGS